MCSKKDNSSNRNSEILLETITIRALSLRITTYKVKWYYTSKVMITYILAQIGYNAPAQEQHLSNFWQLSKMASKYIFY